MQWRLFEEGTIPDFTTVEFFKAHPWISPVHQLGHAQRMRMTADLIREVVLTECGIQTVTDLGCGDGSLLSMIGDVGLDRAWGYDAGTGNVERADEFGLDVRQADLLTDFDTLEFGDLVVASEVIEHLVDPHGFVAKIPSRYAVLSSPSAETGDWHYYHHAWAWDMEGYSKLATDVGWKIIEHVDCEAEVNHHNGETREQRFQAIALVRP